MPIRPVKPVMPLSKSGPKKMVSRLSSVSDGSSYTYVTPGGSASLFGQLVDAYLKDVSDAVITDAAATTFLTTYVTDGGGIEGSYMTVNYHIAYANVLENAIKASVDASTVVGPITYGGQLNLETSSAQLTTLISAVKSLNPELVLDSSSFDAYNGSYWHFVNEDTTIPSLRTVDVISNATTRTYTIQNGVAAILYSPNAGTDWYLDLVNGLQSYITSDTIGVLDVNGITTLSIDLTNQDGYLDINPVNGAVGSYTIDINTANVETFLNDTYVPNDSLGALNSSLLGIYESLNVIGTMMGNMNSTFFKSGVETQYAVNVATTNGSVVTTPSFLIDQATITSSITTVP